jgi:hypothetical protein
MMKAMFFSAWRSMKRFLVMILWVLAAVRPGNAEEPQDGVRVRRMSAQRSVAKTLFPASSWWGRMSFPWQAHAS